jgi:sugar phosphate isomerase/epimerase
MVNVTSRRGFLALSSAALAGLTLPRPAAARKFDEPLGFQIHSLREWLLKDFDGTLRAMRAMGYSSIELTSFPGFRGNLRGDYGPLSDKAPREIRRSIAAAGLRCESCHFFPWQFEESRFGATAEWAHEAGIRYLVLTGLEPRVASLDAWRREFDRVGEFGERVRRAGLQLGFHTDSAVWSVLDDTLVMDEFLRTVPARLCLQQLDLAGIVDTGFDVGPYLARHRGRFRWLHLRDGVKPDVPGRYIPSLVPGRGVIDWRSVLDGARRSGVEVYIVEMMVLPPSGAVDAYRESLQYLRSLEL